MPSDECGCSNCSSWKRYSLENSLEMRLDWMVRHECGKWIYQVVRAFSVYNHHQCIASHRVLITWKRLDESRTSTLPCKGRRKFRRKMLRFVCVRVTLFVFGAQLEIVNNAYAKTRITSQFHQSSRNLMNCVATMEWTSQGPSQKCAWKQRVVVSNRVYNCNRR